MARKRFKEVKENINIEGAKLLFRNFSGKEGQYNPAGNRNFAVALDPEIAKELEDEGWNVRWLRPRNEEDQEQPILSVKVAFGRRPPKIIIVNSMGAKTQLFEEQVQLLDWADIEYADITINPYNWEAAGKRGVKAYLKTMYVKIQEDPWEQKYKNPPDSAQSDTCQPGYEWRDGACRLIEE